MFLSFSGSFVYTHWKQLRTLQVINATLSVHDPKTKIETLCVRVCVIGRAWRLVDSIFLTANLKKRVNLFFVFLPFEVWTLECTSTLNSNKQSNQWFHLFGCVRIWMEFSCFIYPLRIPNTWILLLTQKQPKMTNEHTSIMSKKQG